VVREMRRRPIGQIKWELVTVETKSFLSAEDILRWRHNLR
jgi:hypothetical protein